MRAATSGHLPAGAGWPPTTFGSISVPGPVVGPVGLALAMGPSATVSVTARSEVCVRNMGGPPGSEAGGPAPSCRATGGPNSPDPKNGAYSGKSSRVRAAACTTCAPLEQAAAPQVIAPQAPSRAGAVGLQHDLGPRSSLRVPRGVSRRG